MLRDTAATYAPRADDASLTFIVRIPDDLPAVQGDAERFGQIAASLLSNAIKFTGPGGTVTLTAWITDSSDIGFNIYDTGIGMSPGEIETATIPFARLHEQDYLTRNDAVADAPTSTRLGLPLARLLTEAHDGTLTIESVPGAGTAVSIRLPASRIITPDADQQNANARLRRASGDC